jgi:hypothetical protein
MDNNFSENPWYNPVPITNCECGLFKVYGESTNLSHSDYCPKFTKFELVKSCVCSPSGWHNPNCHLRPTEPIVEKNVIPNDKQVSELLQNYSKELAKQNKW